MFRQATGYKAQCADLAVLIGADFDEWRIILQGPGILIHGGRQLSEAKAKECARRILEEVRRTPPPDLEWAPLTPGEWMNWHP